MRIIEVFDFFHGGNWMAGDEGQKETVRFFMRRITTVLRLPFHVSRLLPLPSLLQAGKQI
jgi:hypothetical protein